MAILNKGKFYIYSTTFINLIELMCEFNYDE